MNNDKYSYVGSQEIRLSVANYPIGTVISSIEDLKKWIFNTLKSLLIFHLTLLLSLSFVVVLLVRKLILLKMMCLFVQYVIQICQMNGILSDY